MTTQKSEKEKKKMKTMAKTTKIDGAAEGPP